MIHTSRRQLRPAAAGFSLVEMIVAVAIFAVIMLAAYKIYDESQRSFLLGEQATDQQQSTRIGLDKMASELTLAGFDVNRQGTNEIDEKIEAISENAVVFQANLNFDDPDEPGVVEDHGREIPLEGPTHVQTTSNAEIVAYALVSDDAGANGDSLDVTVDTSIPRDDEKETLTIDDIDLTNDNPPYTLYRYNVNAAGTGFDRDVVATSIRSLKFKFFDAGNEEIPAASLEEILGSEDAEAEIAVTFPSGRTTTFNPLDWRASVTRIGIELIGMTARIDPQYTDPTETLTSNRKAMKTRKFRMATNVVPINMAMEGEADTDDEIPEPPSNVEAHPGHCRGLFITWELSTSADVDSYNVSYGPVDPPGAIQVVGGSTINWTYIPGLLRDTTYYVEIRAADGVGNLSEASNKVSATTSNETTPKQPQSILVEKTNQEDTSASNDPSAPQPYLKISWERVAENVPPGVPGDPVTGGDTPWRDVDGGGYQLERAYGLNDDGTTVNPMDDAAFDARKEVVANQSQLAGKDLVTFIDKNVARCAPYFYRVRAVDNCSPDPADGSISDGPWSTVSTEASSDAIDPPEAAPKPRAVTHNWAGTSPPNPLTIRFEWSRVTVDTAGVAARVPKYQIEAQPFIGTSPQTALPLVDVWVNPSTDPVVYDYSYSGADPNWTVIEFKVRAVFPCTPEIAGAYSPVTKVPCVIPSPPVLQVTDGFNTFPSATDFFPAPITIRADIDPVLTSPPTSTLSGAYVTVRRVADGTDVVSNQLMTLQGSGIYDTRHVWNAAAETAGPTAYYDITVIVVRADGCAGRVTQRIRLMPLPSCCLQNNFTSTTDVVLTPTGGSPGSRRVLATWKVIQTNECGLLGIGVSVETITIRLARSAASAFAVPNLTEIRDVTGGAPGSLLWSGTIPAATLMAGTTITLTTPLVVPSTRRVATNNPILMRFVFSTQLQNSGGNQHGLNISAGYVAADSGNVPLPPAPAPNSCWVAPVLTRN